MKQTDFYIGIKILALFVFLLTTLLVSCQSTPQSELPTLVPTASVGSTATFAALDTLEIVEESLQSTYTSTLTLTPAPIHTIITRSTLPSAATTVTAISTVQLPPTLTSTLVFTVEMLPSLTPSATLEPTATFWPTVTRQVLPADIAAELVSCDKRIVTDDLLLIATQQFSLPESYTPPDLVLLSDYFPTNITRDQALYVRAVMIDPLQQMINEMHAAGLQPSVLSAYRSYNEQAMAWRWWNSQYPDRVAIMSARPGNSEHQLGTTIDFGSPELNHIFHVDFANTAEGVWLANNSHRFGFTLSYPANSYSITGFKYEPWHYRYIGTERAEQLWGSRQTLTEWQLINLPPPCVP